MTHTIVTRVALGVCVLCVGAAALFATLSVTSAPQAEAAATEPAKPSGPHPGEALYDRHCVGCHAFAEAEGLLKARGADLDANAKSMIDFLKSHGSASDEEDELIVEFMRLQVK